MAFFAKLPTFARNLNVPSTRLTALRVPGRCFVSVDISKAQEEVSSSQHRKRKQRTKQRRDSGRAAYRFVDQTRVHVSGGMGGKGSLSLHHMGRKHKKRPDGGHGGNGGSVVIVADPNEQSLRWTHPHIVAESGKHGSSQNKIGRKGKNTVLRVPCGVVVRRVLNYDEVWDQEAKMVRKMYTEQESPPLDNVAESQHISVPIPNQPYLASNDYDSDEESDDDVSDDEYEGSTLYDDYLTDEQAESENSSLNFVAWGEREKVVVAELDEPGSFVVVARGGQGGKGSGAFATYHGPVPHELLSENATPTEGESAFLELELKMISDLGFVGFPNAGKSSLLSAMSRASPHIAPYPFTTLNPLVGYIEYRDGFRVCAADIPGLIAGASEGRGRGHDFLRHLERTKALLYIVDAAGVDGRDPVEDFHILVDELAAYGDGSMLERDALVVANKVDLLSPTKYEAVRTRLDAIVQEAGIHMYGEILGISAGVTGEGLATLSKAIREVVLKSQSPRP